MMLIGFLDDCFHVELGELVEERVGERVLDSDRFRDRLS